ncbi:hypothetical protein K443DRAFT_110204, partial [Laccaria amethystina LaAM-08-1]
TYQKWIYSEAPPELTEWNAHPFKFGIRFSEIELNKNNLTSFRNMLPNRSKPAFGSVESRVYYKKSRPTGETTSRVYENWRATERPPEFTKHGAQPFKFGVWY